MSEEEKNAASCPIGGCPLCDECNEGLKLEHEHHDEDEREHSHEHDGLNLKREIIMLASSAVLLAAGLLTEGILSVTLLYAAYAAVGIPILIGAVEGLFKGRFADENVLMSVATIGALALGEQAEAVMVMLLYRLGELLQGLAVRRSRASINAALNIRPDMARVLRGGTESVVRADDVAVGETVVVKPGERIPVDGRVIAGESYADCSAITGEAVPVRIAPGDAVLSGSINTSGAVSVIAEKTAGESTASRILRAVEEASGSKPRIQNFITRFARVYTPVVMALTVLIAVLPPLFGAGSFSEWIHRGLLLLVISCPCALVLSVPLTFFAGLARESSSGVLLKGANVMEALVRSKVVAFDKTGTITKGAFEVTSAQPADGFVEQELIDYAAALERMSAHPVAQAIVRASKNGLAAASMTERAGFGVSGLVESKRVLVGNARLLEAEGVAHPAQSEAKSLTFVAVEGKYAGVIFIDDEIKPQSAAAIRRIRESGRHVALLTGDSRAAAESVARQVGIEDVHASLLPEDKLDVLKSLRAQKGPVIFVGDGINDAPVLAGADVGCAIGLGGTDAAVEAADMVLMREDLGVLPEGIRVARRTLDIAKANIIFALAVKGIVMVLGVFNIAQMWMAVFADVGTTLLCVLNALRLLIVHKKV